MLLNLEYAIKCDAYVGTLASNWCRLVDELRATVGVCERERGSEEESERERERERVRERESEMREKGRKKERNKERGVQERSGGREK